MTTFSFAWKTVIENEDIHNNVLLENNDKRYTCRGGTALFDTVGDIITKLINTNKPDVKTVVAIITDGEENASAEFTGAAVKRLIETAESEHGFDVLFLGANIDVEAYVKTIGVKLNKAMLLGGDGDGYRTGMNTINAAAAMCRSGNFNDDIDIKSLV